MKKDWMIKESELDDAQIRVLTATLDKSCVVQGCAGSGKSVLALIKAQRIQKERGNNYKVIVFTKALCSYMNSGREALGLKNNFSYYWEWENKEKCASADYIILDEIQDFNENEIKRFINSAKKNYFFFGDTAQSIYDGMDNKKTVPVDQIMFFVPNRNTVKTFELYHNYRLPVPIAKVACQIGLDTQYVDGIYKSSEKELPRIIQYEKQDQQIDAIHRIIKNRNLSDVAILLPQNKDVKSVYEKLKEKGGNYEARYNVSGCSSDNLNFHSTNPKILTYHSAKGLQFETVFIPFLEDADMSKRKQLYVAMTRTYRDLYMMYSGKLPKLFSELDRTLYTTTEVEEIEDL